MKKRKITLLGILSITLLFILSGFGSALSLIGTTNQNDYDVELILSDFADTIIYLPANPGSTCVINVIIKNTGTKEDTYDVTASSIEDIICIVEDFGQSFTIQPGAILYLYIVARIYDNVEEVPIGEWEVIITARSQNDTNVEDTITANINIDPEDLPLELYTPGKTRFYTTSTPPVGLPFKVKVVPLKVKYVGDDECSAGGPFLYSYYVDGGELVAMAPVMSHYRFNTIKRHSWIFPYYLIEGKPGKHIAIGQFYFNDSATEKSGLCATQFTISITQIKGKSMNSMFNQFPLLEKIFQLLA